MGKFRNAYFLGMAAAGFPIAAISVYVFHDVDLDRVGQWNLAFSELCQETTAFILITGGLVMFLVWLSRIPFRLQSVPLNPKLGFRLGVAVILLQYPFEFACRRLFPNHDVLVAASYILFSSVVCALLVLRDGFARLSETKQANV